MAVSVSHLSIIDKINQDVAECVVSLRSQFEENDNFPISEESVILQRFCAKLEFLLHHDIKEKSTVLGGKKGYWDYLCQCLSSSRKQPHEGIRFVKLKTELKTSQGRGRAFIRFCLSHGCLAETLQYCFDQNKITLDWYSEKAIPCNKEKWSSLICSLYELNDIHFDLSPDCYGLDVSWPTFSRSKTFDSRLSWQPPSRSLSVASLNSQPEGSLSYQMEEQKESSELEQKIYELCQAEADLYESRQRNVEMLKKEAKLLKEIEELKLAVEKATNEGTLNAEKLVEEYASKMECLEIQHATREEYFKEAQTAADEKIMGLESEKLEFQNQIFDLSKLLEELQLSTSKTEETFTNKVSNLENEKTNLQEQLTRVNQEFMEKSSILQSTTNKLVHLNSQLLSTEEDMKKVEAVKIELLQKLEKFEVTSQSLKGMIEEVNKRNIELEGEVKRLNEELRNKTIEAESALVSNNKLSEEKNVLETKVDELLRSITDKNLELESLRIDARNSEERVALLSNSSANDQTAEFLSKISDLEAVNKHLREDMKCLVDNLHSEKGTEDFYDKKIGRINCDWERILENKRSELDEVNSKLASFEQYGFLLTPLISQHEITINHLYKNIDILFDASQKLKMEMKTLAFSMQRLANCSNSQLEFTSLREDPNVLFNEGIQIHSQEASSYADISVPTNNNFPLVNSMQSLVTSLRSITLKNEDIGSVVKSCQAFCLDMNNFAEERERKLMAKTIKLRHSKNVVAALAKEHKKMQSAEAILKYELQEKRKLLTRLRHQLESTHDEWSRVRKKNLESEEEWKSLREDFAKRHKQASEESGFVEEKPVEESASEANSTPSLLESVPENHSIEEPSCSSVNGAESSLSSSVCEGAVGGSDTLPIPTEEEPEARPRSRLEILEEQCNILYFSLLNSSKKSEILEQRLQAILGHHEENSISTSSEDSGACAAHSEVAPVSESSDIVEDIEGSEENGLEEDEIGVSEASITSTVPVWNAVDEENLLLYENSFPNVFEFQVNGEVLANDSRETLENHEASPSPQSESFDGIRKKALENIVVKFKNERKVHEAKEMELKKEIERLENCSAELESKVAELQLRNTSVASKESDFRKRAEFIFRQERDSFVNKIQLITVECAELQKKVDQSRSDLNRKEDELENANLNANLMKQQRLDSETSLNQEVSSLQFQLSTEALKFERALKHYTGQESTILEMREKINQQEQLIYSLEESLDEIRDERNNETDRRCQELEDLQISLSTRDEECVALSEDLKALTIEFNDVKTYLSQVEEQAHKVESGYRLKLNSLQSEIEQLQQDNEELKRQIIKLTRDKDSLWKKSEQLSQICAPPTGDRWMPDNEVNECMHCRSTFSFTLRKHHCRLCGRIFCHSCAGHWILTASSSRRSRVCQECYSQHEEKKSSFRETGDDDDDMLDSQSFISDRNQRRSSSTDAVSVDSLPNSNISNFEPSSCREASENMQINSSPSKSGVDLDSEKAEDTACRLDFDIISDEEITRSLSACSPYSPVPSPSNSISPEMPSSVTRTVKDINQAGSDGLTAEVWVNAGSTYSVPLLIEESGVVINWEFSSSPKSIAFSVACKEANTEKPELDILLKTTKVQSHLRPVQGQIVGKHPGLYILMFDNHFSKFLAKKVTYCLKIHRASNRSEISE